MQTDKQLTPSKLTEVEKAIEHFTFNSGNWSCREEILQHLNRILISQQQPIQEGEVLYRKVDKNTDYGLSIWGTDEWFFNANVEPITLTAIKKEVASKAFMAGCDFSFAADYGPVLNPCPDKQTYLDNL